MTQSRTSRATPRRNEFLEGERRALVSFVRRTRGLAVAVALEFGFGHRILVGGWDVCTRVPGLPRAVAADLPVARGEASGHDLWRRLRASSKLGVTRGSLDHDRGVRRSPVARESAFLDSPPREPPTSHRENATMPATMSELETAARRLALENASDGDILRIYWFPDDRQIRLVEVDALSIRDADEEVRPLYFAPRSNTRFPMGIALIHPDEERRKALPADWATAWERGEIVYDRERPVERS